MTTRDRVIAEARALLGVRFRHQGRHAVHGLDCLGLLLVVAERSGLTIAGQPARALDACDYGSRPDAMRLQATLEQALCLRTGSAQPGDVLLLKIQGAPQHLALVSDYPQPGALGMIHAYALARRVVEHRYDDAWQQATHAIYYFPA